MLRLAYEKTVDNTGKVSFPYIHKILSTWHEKGFQKPEEALSESAPPEKQKKEEKKGRYIPVMNFIRIMCGVLD